MLEIGKFGVYGWSTVTFLLIQPFIANTCVIKLARDFEFLPFLIRELIFFQKI